MSRIKDAILRTVSGVAASLNLPSIKPRADAKPQFMISNHAGRHGEPYRRIIQHVVHGPFFRQIGTSKDGKPIMQQHVVHRFLHATKGWRAYGRGMPSLHPKSNNGRPSKFNKQEGKHAT